MTALGAHGRFLFLLRGCCRTPAAQFAFAELPVGFMVHRQHRGHVFPEKAGKGAQFGLFQCVVEQLKARYELFPQQIVRLQRQTRKGHAHTALKIVQQPAFRLAFQSVEFGPRCRRVRQQQHEASARIHDARRMGQFQTFQQHQPDGTRQRLQQKGARPQQLSRALVAAVRMGGLAEDEFLDAAQVRAKEQKTFLPFRTGQQGLRNGRRGGCVIMERNVRAGAVGR